MRCILKFFEMLCAEFDKLLRIGVDGPISALLESLEVILPYQHALAKILGR